MVSRYGPLEPELDNNDSIERRLLTSLQRGLIGPIISRFENRGFQLVAMKLTSPSKEHLETHYADLSTKPFFKGLVSCSLLHAI